MAKVKKKKKKAAKRKLLINLSLLLIILGIVAGVGLKSSYFLIKEVKVKNNKVVTKEEIQSLSNLKGKNIFLINKESISKGIKAHPYIDDVKLERGFPSSVTVDIKEKKISAGIKLKEGYVNVDENGKMVQKITNFPLGKLPLIENISAAEYKANANVYKDENQISALKECLAVIDNNQLNTVFAAVDVSDPFNIKLTTPSSIIVDVGSKNNINYKISLAISVLNSEEVKNKKGYMKVLDNGTATFKED